MSCTKYAQLASMSTEYRRKNGVERTVSASSSICGVSLSIAETASRKSAERLDFWKPVNQSGRPLLVSAVAVACGGRMTRRSGGVAGAHAATGACTVDVARGASVRARRARVGAGFRRNAPRWRKGEWRHMGETTQKRGCAETTPFRNGSCAHWPNSSRAALGLFRGAAEAAGLSVAADAAEGEACPTAGEARPGDVSVGRQGGPRGQDRPKITATATGPPRTEGAARPHATQRAPELTARALVRADRDVEE